MNFIETIFPVFSMGKNTRSYPILFESSFCNRVLDRAMVCLSLSFLKLKITILI